MYNFFVLIWPLQSLQLTYIDLIHVKFIPLHKKLYFLSLRISWKIQKYQVNIIFPSTYWLQKRPYFTSPKILK